MPNVNQWNVGQLIDAMATEDAKMRTDESRLYSI